MNNGEKPSRRLATEVVDKLVGAGLLRGGRRDALIDKVAVGDMKAGDWKLEVELASTKADAA